MRLWTVLTFSTGAEHNRGFVSVPIDKHAKDWCRAKLRPVGLYLENCWQAYITVTFFPWFDVGNSLLKSVQAYYEYIHSVQSNPPSGGGRDFQHPSRPAPGPNQPPVQRVKVKVKFTLEQVTKDQRRSRGIALLFL